MQSQIKHESGKIREYLYTYRHGFIMIGYMFIYMIWFGFINSHKPGSYRMIRVDFDAKIPFCEYFVIPYYLWFIYVATVILIAIFKNKEEYYKGSLFLMVGMTIFLVVSTLWPNGQTLRPGIMAHDNLFTDLVWAIYTTDAPRNLWPSIHVYNSIGAYLLLKHIYPEKKFLNICSLLLCISIILSTVFIKQHSVFDVATALFLALLMYVIVYHTNAVNSIRNHFHNSEILR